MNFITLALWIKLSSSCDSLYAHPETHQLLNFWVDLGWPDHPKVLRIICNTCISYNSFCLMVIIITLITTNIFVNPTVILHLVVLFHWWVFVLCLLQSSLSLYDTSWGNVFLWVQEICKVQLSLVCCIQDFVILFPVSR